MIYGPGKCVESIAMMIYYCQGTGCSLSSQYSLQESNLKNIFEHFEIFQMRQAFMYSRVVYHCKTVVTPCDSSKRIRVARLFRMSKFFEVLKNIFFRLLS